MLQSAFVVGVDHHLSSLDERTTLNALDIENLKDSLSLKELYVLSTCNRFEIYGVAPCNHSAGMAKKELEGALKEKTNLNIEGHVYQKTGEDMLRHGFNVASSLESMVVGEPQILGQMKKAYHAAKENGTIGQNLDKFLTTAFHVGKRVRHETLLSQEPVSVASAAVHAMKQHVSPQNRPLIVVVGAGDMCKAAIKHLHSSNYDNLVILNRTLSSAVSLAETIGVTAAPLAHLEKWLLKADAVMTCIDVDQPIMTYHMLQKSLKDMVLVDMAVPRNVESSVNELDKVTLIDMDALSSFIDLSKEKRASYIGDATRIVDEEVEAFTKWTKERQNAHMVHHLRSSFESIRGDVLEGFDSKEAEMATHLLLNKILHHPTMMIKSGYVPTQGVEMAVNLMFGLRCPRVQFLQINAESVNKGECPFVDVMRAEGLKSKVHH